MGERIEQNLRRLQAVGGDQGLAEAYAAVSCGNFGVEIDFEGFGAQAIQQRAK